MASRPESGSMVLEAVSEAVSEAIDAAHSAGLHYVTEHSPGYQRMKSGRGFRYLTADGQRVTDKRELARIKALAIPPAWTEVWICASAHGHIQAFGRDARRRKQYRYHVRWREVRDETKFGQLLEFGAT